MARQPSADYQDWAKRSARAMKKWAKELAAKGYCSKCGRFGEHECDALRQMTDRDTHDEWRSQNVEAVLDDSPDDVVFYSAEEIARFKADGWRRVGEGWAKP